LHEVINSSKALVEGFRIDYPRLGVSEVLFVGKTELKGDAALPILTA